jgi:hypothetical protein
MYQPIIPVFPVLNFSSMELQKDHSNNKMSFLDLYENHKNFLLKNLEKGIIHSDGTIKFGENYEGLDLINPCLNIGDNDEYDLRFMLSEKDIEGESVGYNISRGLIERIPIFSVLNTPYVKNPKTLYKLLNIPEQDTSLKSIELEKVLKKSIHEDYSISGKNLKEIEQDLIKHPNLFFKKT